MAVRCKRCLLELVSGSGNVIGDGSNKLARAIREVKPALWSEIRQEEEPELFAIKVFGQWPALGNHMCLDYFLWVLVADKGWRDPDIGDTLMHIAIKRCPAEIYTRIQLGQRVLEE